LTQQLSKLISAYQMTPVQVLWAVIILYLVLWVVMPYEPTFATPGGRFAVPDRPADWR